MGNYFIRRLLFILPSVFLCMLLVFFIIHMIPGDPVLQIIAGRPASTLVIENLRHKMGLDLPLHKQLTRFISNAFRGDFGISFNDRRDVVEKYMEVLPFSIYLALGSFVVSFALGIPMGILAGIFPHSWIDNVLMVLAIVGVSLPGFFAGLLLIYLFCITLDIFPVLGNSGSLSSLVLPSISTGLWGVGNVARLLRSSILEIAQEDYVRTALAKGLSVKRTAMTHALRNALIPVVTFLGVQLATNLGALAITETVFNRRGIGRLLLNGVIALDYPVVQFGVLLITVVFIFINLLVDLLYGVIDPRIVYD